MIRVAASGRDAHYLAALAWFAGPGPAGDIVAKIPVPTILRIARILLDSQESALLAGFARHVSASALRATVEELCGLELLRLAGELDPPDIVNAIARHLTDRQIDAAIAAIPTADLWHSFSDLIDAFDVDLRQRLLDRLIHAPAAVADAMAEAVAAQLVSEVETDLITEALTARDLVDVHGGVQVDMGTTDRKV